MKTKRPRAVVAAGAWSNLFAEGLTMESVQETWRDIKGYEGIYQVSDLGRVRSLDHVVVRRVGSPFRCRGKMLGTTNSRNGYSTASVGGNKYIHHLVLEAFVGPRPDGYEACHNNGNRQDNRLSNLRWDTPQANQADRVQHGTSNRGERCASAKLTQEQALAIFHSTEPGCELAKRYGVAEQTVCNIRKGRRWNHLTGAIT